MRAPSAAGSTTRSSPTALTQMRSDMAVRVADQLTAASTESARTMVELMKPAYPPAVRRGASRAVVELSMKARESADLQNRMAELERRLDAQVKVRQGHRRGVRDDRSAG